MGLHWGCPYLGELSHVLPMFCSYLHHMMARGSPAAAAASAAVVAGAAAR